MGVFEMMDRPQSTVSPDGERLHLQYGPIYLIVAADGPRPTRNRAFTAATNRFDGLLEELVDELDFLRTPLDQSPEATRPVPAGVVAQRMLQATWPLRRHELLSPMAAVAGSVADEIGASITAQCAGGGLTRWMVNNGGDISFGLSPGQIYKVGLVTNPLRFDPEAGVDSTIKVSADMGIGGVATSGRHGRSFSLGIADSVTALAKDAARADAAATLITNRVDLVDHPAVQRTPANELEPDNDLGARLVTVGVAALSTQDVAVALASGLEFAQSLVAQGLIVGAHLALAGQSLSIGSTDRPGLEHGLGV